MALEDNLSNVWLLQANSNDSKGSNNGTDTSISYSSPQSGYANFSSSKITLGTAITRPSDVTLMVWVKWTSGADNMVFCDSDASAGSDWYLRINSDGKIRWAWARAGSGDNGAWTTDSVVIADGNLHCIIVTHSSPTATPIVYVDATSKSLTGSGSGTLGVGTTTTFGTFGALGTQSYSGAMRMIALWSRSVTSGEATTLYNGGVIPGFSGGVFTFITNFTRSLADSIMNGASRSATVSRLATYFRATSDSIMNGASRSATVARILGFPRGLSDSIMNGASRLATVSRLATYLRGPADSIMNGASRLATVTRSAINWVANLSDSIMNGASRLTVLTSLQTRFIFKPVIMLTNIIKPKLNSTISIIKTKILRIDNTKPKITSK